MNKIISLNNAIKISRKLKENGKTIVLTGGCFDILHVGHIKLLEKSKKLGDILFVLVENDKTVSKLKGKGRPINPQSDRAKILSAISYVDYVVLLPEMSSNNDYDLLMQSLKPNTITNTIGDSQAIHNKRQAKLINAKAVSVTTRIKNKSTTNLAHIISKNFK